MICLKSNFHIDNTRQNGVQRQCVSCAEEYHGSIREKQHRIERKRRQTVLLFRLVGKLKNTIRYVFKSQKIEKIIKLLI